MGVDAVRGQGPKDAARAIRKPRLLASHESHADRDVGASAAALDRGHGDDQEAGNPGTDLRASRIRSTNATLKRSVALLFVVFAAMNARRESAGRFGKNAEIVMV